MKLYEIPGQCFLGLYQEWHTILQVYNRQKQLSGLIAWAKRKRLSRPRKLYEHRLEEEQNRLFRYKLGSPRLSSLAYIAYVIRRIFIPTPRYPRKGSASIYHYNRLTQKKKSHSIFFRST
jgi:hypothetical protein